MLSHRLNRVDRRAFLAMVDQFFLLFELPTSGRVIFFIRANIFVSSAIGLEIYVCIHAEEMAFFR